MLKVSKLLLPSFLALGLLNTACSSDDAGPEEIIQATEDFSEAALPDQMDDYQLSLEADGYGADTFDYSSKTIFFDFDDDRVKYENQAMLQHLADHLSSNGESVVIEGHCDERGSAEYNLALGQRRAYSVKSYLMTLGVAEHQMSTISYGEEKPLAFGQTEEAYSQNRRVEFSPR